MNNRGLDLETSSFTVPNQENASRKKGESIMLHRESTQNNPPPKSMTHLLMTKQHHPDSWAYPHVAHCWLVVHDDALKDRH